MTEDGQVKRDWVRFFELKGRISSNLRVFKWRGDIKWRDDFPSDRQLVLYGLLHGGLDGLHQLFLYLTDMYCYAEAAETIGKEYENKGDKEIMGFWRYRVRNYHFYDFIPRYFSFLDHAAYFVASLSQWELVKGTPLEKKGTMYYHTFLPELCKSFPSADKIGCLTQSDRKILYEFLRGMDVEPKDPELNRIARSYRQDTTHLFFPGIDRTTRIVTPEFAKNGKKKTYDVVAWGLGGGPEYRFDELKKLAEVVIPMIDNAFKLLFETDAMKSCLKEEQT